MHAGAIKVNYYWKGSVIDDREVEFTISKAKLMETIQDMVSAGGKLKMRPAMVTVSVKDLDVAIERVDCGLKYVVESPVIEKQVV